MSFEFDREVWRAVPSVPGLMASSNGRLMISPYVAPLPNDGARQYGGTPTVGQWDGARYVYVLRGKTYRMARLICEAFRGPPPQEDSVCMHLDENARNNRPNNLAWGTQKQNLNAPGFLAYCRARRGEQNPFIKGRKRKDSLR